MPSHLSALHSLLHGASEGTAVPSRCPIGQRCRAVSSRLPGVLLSLQSLIQMLYLPCSFHNYPSIPPQESGHISTLNVSSLGSTAAPSHLLSNLHQGWRQVPGAATSVLGTALPSFSIVCNEIDSSKGVTSPPPAWSQVCMSRGHELSLSWCP